MDSATPPNEAESPVQKQMEAYNARDIDRFMECWADDCQYYEFPTRLLADGAAEIRERHITRFQEPNLFGKLIKRISVANMVVGIYAGNSYAHLSGRPRRDRCDRHLRGEGRQDSESLVQNGSAQARHMSF